MNLINNSSFLNNSILNNTGFIFKKKNLKNSFSISSKKLKRINNFNTYKNNISIDKGEKFQIIPNLKTKKNNKKKNYITLREKCQTNNNMDFRFYTLSDLKKIEDKNIKYEEKRKDNKQQIFNDQFNLKKLLNQIIKIKNKHKMEHIMKLNNNKK